MLMPIQRPFSFKKWIDENRHLLKPPVGNQMIYKQVDDLIIMVVGGPNKRKDYHFNESEEFYYQIEGDMVLKIIEDGKPVDIPINEGDIFMLPGNTPHSPQRPENTVGLVIELVRKNKVEDAFMWFCESCGNKLYEEFLHVENIVSQLPPVMNRFYGSEELRTCSKCKSVMVKP
jgi:3-hydroxyanthranilate 3,4-dioxygenase